MNKTLKVAVIGLGFGAEFVPIYQDYSLTQCYAVCRRDRQKLEAFDDEFQIEKRYTDYDQLLQDPEIDAVHINTAIADHASMSIKALKAGKHVACTVPMGLTVDECAQIVQLERETGKVYMMMETSVYTRDYLFAKDMVQNGKIGRIQFVRGSHQQNMGLPGWPDYWYGFPPMYYGTHAIAPVADLIGKPIRSVRCYGSGRIREDYIPKYGSPYAVETSQLLFDTSDVAAEVTRSLFDTIRQYRESFDLYGSNMSFEWEQLADENPVVYSGIEDAQRVIVPDTDHLLPPEIAKYALRNQIIDKDHVSFVQGAGHGGSHPHLVKEFVSAILEGRHAKVDAATAANWTLAGILSHQSAMEGGKEIVLPQF